MEQSKAILDDPLKFYDKRIKELQTLKSDTSSKTLSDLIQGAIDLSHTSVPKLIHLLNTTTTYLRQEQAKYNESSLKIDEQINLLNREIQKVQASSDIPEKLKFLALEKLNQALKLGLKTKTNKQDVMQLQNAVIPQTSLTFQEVLLNLIYKPNHSTFQYDAVIDGLKLIGGMIIPAFDSLNTVSNIPLSSTVRKKQYVKTGDKILTYVEQYIDVLERWNSFADQFAVILK